MSVSSWVEPALPCCSRDTWLLTRLCQLEEHQPGNLPSPQVHEDLGTDVHGFQILSSVLRTTEEASEELTLVQGGQSWLPRAPVLMWIRGSDLTILPSKV